MSNRDSRYLWGQSNSAFKRRVKREHDKLLSGFEINSSEKPTLENIQLSETLMVPNFDCLPDNLYPPVINSFCADDSNNQIIFGTRF